MCVFWQGNQLEADQKPLCVLAEEFIEIALVIHADGLLENKPITECVQMMPMRQLPHGFIVVVGVDECTNAAVNNIIHGVVVDAHDGPPSLELIKGLLLDKTVVLSTKAVFTYITNRTKCQQILSKMWCNMSQCCLQSREHTCLISLNQLDPCSNFCNSQLNRSDEGWNIFHRFKELSEFVKLVGCQ